MFRPDDAFAFVETGGFPAAVCAADAMGKAARVRLCLRRLPGAGRVLVMIAGDLASCLAAIEAGKAVACAMDGYLQSVVLPRPAEDIEALFTTHMPAAVQRKKARSKAASQAESGKSETPATVPGKQKAAPCGTAKKKKG